MCDGQVAQLVEQGTENPRVGGSTPSLATTALAAAFCLFATACQPDACEQLCRRVSRDLAVCLEQWPASWQDLDATKRTDFVARCENGWSVERADLEPRELEDALDQCDETIAAMPAQGSEESCDTLRALYLE